MTSMLLEGHELLAVVIHTQDQKLEAKIRDNQGRLRSIEFRWLTKDTSAVPEYWIDSINGEIEYQRTEELNKSQGRFIP